MGTVGKSVRKHENRQEKMLQSVVTREGEGGPGHSAAASLRSESLASSSQFRHSEAGPFGTWSVRISLTFPAWSNEFHTV